MTGSFKGFTGNIMKFKDVADTKDKITATITSSARLTVTFDGV